MLEAVHSLSKSGGILDWKLGSAGRWLTRNVLPNPLLMAMIQAPAGYLAGHYLASPVAEFFSPSRTEEAKRRRRRNFSLMGLGAGLLPPALTTFGRMRPDYKLDAKTPIPGTGEGLGSALLRPFHAKQSEDLEKESYVPAWPGTENIIMNDPVMSPYEKAVAMQSVANALAQSDKKGMFTVGDLVRGAIGAGLGYGGARVAGKLLGFSFGLSPSAQKRLGQIGAIGGLLGNTGILRV